MKFEQAKEGELIQDIAKKAAVKPADCFVHWERQRTAVNVSVGGRVIRRQDAAAGI